MPTLSEVEPSSSVANPTGYVRAMFVGFVHWECPECATLNHARIKGPNRRIRCSDSACRKQFVFGLVFYEPALGGQIAERVPPDAILGGQLRKRNVAVNRVTTWPLPVDITPAVSVYAP